MGKHDDDQIWHIPFDKTKPGAFRPLSYLNYVFPMSCLGLRVNALDLLITTDPQPSFEEVRALMPGTGLYGSRVFCEDMAVTTSFTPDEHGRERYLITVGSTTPVLHVK
jgi:hypothetical protein